MLLTNKNKKMRKNTLQVFFFDIKWYCLEKDVETKQEEVKKVGGITI